jgi:hypothetical protein
MHAQARVMKRIARFSFAVLIAAAAYAVAQTSAEKVAGIPLYPGASNSDVEGSEKVLKDSGYPTAVCRHTPDSLEKVVAFYSKEKSLSPLGEPSKDNAGFANKAGASMSINSPWINMKTLQMTGGTMVCIADRGGK